VTNNVPTRWQLTPKKSSHYDLLGFVQRNRSGQKSGMGEH
jgi:hypothetical protein